MKKENGFTLVEAIVALFISSLMLVAIYSAMDMAQKSATKIEKRVVGQQDARGALELMSLEIQMASYNPRSSRTIWANPASCSGATPNMTYRGIQEAGANTLTIEMDINDNGTISAADPNEIIKYDYVANTDSQYLERTINCNASSTHPFLGGLAADIDSKTVLVKNFEVGIPVFRYFDGSGTELLPPVTTSIPDIRMVEITLVIDTYSADADGVRKRFVYSNRVVVRNHSLSTY
jgi:prepilin-type N-terminal cleavage/methylation domain-containing protein